MSVTLAFLGLFQDVKLWPFHFFQPSQMFSKLPARERQRDPIIGVLISEEGTARSGTVNSNMLN